MAKNRHGAGCLRGTSSTLAKVDQSSLLTGFRSGSGANVLFSTSVAEEGLDVGHCSFVLLYDVPPRPLSQVQAVGRARARDSSVVLLQAQRPGVAMHAAVRSPMCTLVPCR